MLTFLLIIKTVIFMNDISNSKKKVVIKCFLSMTISKSILVLKIHALDSFEIQIRFDISYYNLLYTGGPTTGLILYEKNLKKTGNVFIYIK